jgi:hypothetical protein
MEPECSLTCSQQPATFSYPEPDESTPHLTTLLKTCLYLFHLAPVTICYQLCGRCGAKMSNRALEKWINIFCVKLGKNARNICAMPSKAYREQAMKMSRVSECHIASKRARISKSQTKIMFVSFVDIKGIVHSKFISQGQRINQAYYIELLKHSHEAVGRKGLNFDPTIGFFTMTMLQLTSSVCFKFGYWDGKPTLFPWCSTEWLVVVSENKVCNKGTKISGHWGHKKVTRALKAIQQQ